MEVNKEKVTALTVTLLTGGLTNLFLLLSLVVTWKYWRQVKWYIVALAAANWLELAFRFGTDLVWHHTVAWRGAEWSCKLLMFLQLLSSNLASMAVAAVGLHTLLTVITGSQGERLRHRVVFGLFLLLSLPLPLVQIPRYRLLPIPKSLLQDGSQQCVNFHFFHSLDQEYRYFIGRAIAIVYWPVTVVILCGVVSSILFIGRKGNVRGEEHVSDLYITGILGAVLVICCVPYYTHFLNARRHGYLSPKAQSVSEKLLYLENCRNILTALFTAAFSYLYVYRKRRETHLSPTTFNEGPGERQKLVQ